MASASITTFRPRRGLEDRIQAIDVIEHAGGEIAVLPSAGAVLGLQYRGRVRAERELLSTAGVTGIQSVARRYRYLGETGSVLVRFTAQGAACLGVPSCELTGHSIALEDLVPAARVRELGERLVELRGARERVALVEDFLVALPYVEDTLVARAMSLIAADVGEGAAVARVARGVGLSERQLERRFQRRIGISPKRYAGLLRFERAAQLARRAASLTAAALDAGYYDQSHFIREFRRYAGASPGEFVRRR